MNRRRWIRFGFGAAFTTAAVVALWALLDDADQVAWPGIELVLVATALVTIGLMAASEAWIGLVFDTDDRQRSSLRFHRAFLLAQLGKYVPGGIWQPIGQLGLASEAGAPIGVATSATLITAWLTVVTGVLYGAVVAVTTDLPILFRALLALSPIVVLASRRRWIVAVVGLVAHRFPQIRERSLIPEQRRLNRAVALHAANFCLQGLGFAALIDATDSDVNLIAATAAFPVAWVLGFLVLPLPGGLGIREAALVALLSASSADLVAAALLHRLATLIAELGLCLAVTLVAWWRHRKPGGSTVSPTR